jgi:hypothetical protein
VIRLEPCNICGEKEGPAVFSDSWYCSEMCRKFGLDEIDGEKFTALTGKTFNHSTGLWDMKTAGKLLEEIRKNP